MKPENEGSLFKRTSIRYMIFVYFTVTALAASIFIGLSLYSRMSKQMSDTMQEENQILIDQLNRSVDVWLRGIMKLSDTTYYGIVKNVDLRNESVNKEMTLLYDNNKDNVENIALFSRDGELLEAVPATRLKTGADPAAEPWFRGGTEKDGESSLFSPACPAGVRRGGEPVPLGDLGGARGGDHGGLVHGAGRSPHRHPL